MKFVFSEEPQPPVPVAKKLSFLKEYGYELKQLVSDEEFKKIPAKTDKMSRLEEFLLSARERCPLIIGPARLNKIEFIKDFISYVMKKGLVKNEKFLLLDTKRLLRGAQDSITVNQRLSTIEENIDRDIILVFDEIHTLFEMGLSVHSLLLNSPVMVTTTSYYARFLENEALFRNRFFVLKIAGLTERETRELLLANLSYFEKKHNIRIPRSVTDSMLNLARKYLPDRPFPDKCFQLLEKAQVRAKIQRRSAITEDDLIDTISDWIELPREKIESDQYLQSREFEDFLSEFAFDKDSIIKDICDEVRLVNSELNPRPDRPKGMFLFIGPKGCGKTSLAKGLAQYLFGSEDKFFYFDMANFQSGNAAWHLISKSKTSEEQEGQLYSLVRDYPFMLLFFDNIQLAHPDILNLLAKIFEEGTILDYQDEPLSFANVTFVMTCNTNNPLPSIGFLTQTGAQKERLTKQLFPQSPNFLKNVSIISFDPLSERAKAISIQKKLEKIVISNLRLKGITVRIEKSVEDFLMGYGFSDEEGARRLEPTVKEYILEPILRFLIRQRKTPRQITLSIKNQSLQVDNF